MDGSASTGSKVSSAIRRRVQDNIKRIKDNIAQAAAKARRQDEEIQLLAVTKTVQPEIIRLLIDHGQLDLGENRVQQLTQRASMLKEHYQRRTQLGEVDLPAPQVRWHMIGHLQRNKVKSLLPWVHLIHSVDTLRLGEEINNQARKAGKVQEVLVEVNCSGEVQKYGVAVAAVGYLAEQLDGLDNLKVIGLMTMAPLVDAPEQARPVFERLQEIFLDVKAEANLNAQFRHMSMGMSQDYQVAIQCGATIVRIGSAIFEGTEALIGS